MHEYDKIVNLINQDKRMLNPNIKFYNVSNIILSSNLTERQRHIVFSYNNKSIDEIANEYGLTRERIRQHLHKSIQIVRKYINDNQLNEYGLTNYMESYNRLLAKINELGSILPALNENNYSQGVATLNFIMATILDERSCNIIKQYFIEEQSYRTIGSSYNLSGERIRQIITRSIRYIKRYLAINKIHDYNTTLTNASYLAQLENESEKHLRTIQQLQHMVDIYKSEVESYKKDINNLQNMINKNADDSSTLVGLNIPFYHRDKKGYITDTIFSTRTTNALIRRDLNTINDIVNLSPSELKKIRNLGCKSITEITTILKNDFTIDYYKLYGVGNE